MSILSQVATSVGRAARVAGCVAGVSLGAWLLYKEYGHKESHDELARSQALQASQAQLGNDLQSQVGQSQPNNNNNNNNIQSQSWLTTLRQDVLHSKRLDELYVLEGNLLVQPNHKSCKIV